MNTFWAVFGRIGRWMRQWENYLRCSFRTVKIPTTVGFSSHSLSYLILSNLIFFPSSRLIYLATFGCSYTYFESEWRVERGEWRGEEKRREGQLGLCVMWYVFATVTHRIIRGTWW